MDGGDKARTIGRRARQIRHSRGKSLRVAAGLAGMSTTHLWRIEHVVRTFAVGAGATPPWLAAEPVSGRDLRKIASTG